MQTERLNRLKFEVSRDRLAHVIPNLQVDGCYILATLLAQELKQQYNHVLLFETPLDKLSAELIWQMQGFGLEVHQVDRIEPETLLKLQCTGAILYNVANHPGLGSAVPSLYYSYGVYDKTTDCAVYVPCSAYAARHGRFAPYAEPMSEEWVLPAMLATRPLRRLKAPAHPFTVGMLTSGAYDKYPCNIVIKLLGKLTAGTALMVSTLPPGMKYKHPGVDLAINARAEQFGSVGMCPIRPMATVSYLLHTDVVVYASSGYHHDPYGRLVIEAMALGKPVICERKGVFGTTLEHGVNVFLYDTVDEIVEYIELLRADKRIAERLSANAQLYASWHDTTAHIGKLKRMLRMIGA